MNKDEEREAREQEVRHWLAENNKAPHMADFEGQLFYFSLFNLGNLWSRVRESCGHRL